MKGKSRRLQMRHEVSDQRKQPQHLGRSTKSYCQKFGGAHGGSLKKNRNTHTHKGRVGVKLEKKLTVHIPSKGII